MACGVEVALGRRLAAQRVGLVGEAHVQCVPVELGVDGDRVDAQLAAGPDDPDGDLATVGDQHLGEHDVWLAPGRGNMPPLRSSAPDSPGSSGWRRPARPTPTCWPGPRRGRPRGRCGSPSTRPPGGARRGRTWVDTPGAQLMVSVLLRPTLPAARARPTDDGVGGGRGGGLRRRHRGAGAPEVAQRRLRPRRATQGGRGAGRVPAGGRRPGRCRGHRHGHELQRRRCPPGWRCRPCPWPS